MLLFLLCKDGNGNKNAVGESAHLFFHTIPKKNKHWCIMTTKKKTPKQYICIDNTMLVVSITAWSHRKVKTCFTWIKDGSD